MVEPAGIVSPMSSAQDTRWVSHIDYTYQIDYTEAGTSGGSPEPPYRDQIDVTLRGMWQDGEDRGSKSAGFSYC